MSSSGLIYAVIVGAWAAYLVPMWLRRQDELNEARPTERFSTAIRLLSGRAGMERRYARELRARTGQAPADPERDEPAESLSSVDVRSYAAPPALTEARIDVRDEIPAPRKERKPQAAARDGDRRSERAQRTRVLARRRRTTITLFAAFTLGTVVAAVGGLGFLWAPGVPALLLSAYIVHLRANERRRFAYTMDRRRAEEAAQRLRATRAGRVAQVPSPSAPAAGDHDAVPAPRPAQKLSAQEAGRRALVEQTDHAEWLDQQRERRPRPGETWDPVPVPLPTYVTAPVAPRATGVEVNDPETWSATRSSPAEPAGAPEHSAPPPPPRRAREHGRTPLFDQYDEQDRPRAANE